MIDDLYDLFRVIGHAGCWVKILIKKTLSKGGKLFLAYKFHIFFPAHIPVDATWMCRRAAATLIFFNEMRLKIARGREKIKNFCYQTLSVDSCMWQLPSACGTNTITFFICCDDILYCGRFLRSYRSIFLPPAIVECWLN